MLDLGPARLERKGKAVHLTAANPRFLNAEDDTTLDLMEIAVDVAILDRPTEIAVHARRPGRASEISAAGGVFGAGINLTHLYRGKIPFVWFLKRDLGYVHKLLRGVAVPECAARRRRMAAASRSRGSPRSMPSPSAATARRSSAWTTCLPPTMPI